MKFIIIATIILYSSVSIASSTDLDIQNKILQKNIYCKIKHFKPYYGDKYVKTISAYFANSVVKYNLPLNVVLAIASLESGFAQWKRGKKKEYGIMQIMPGWAKSKLCKGFKLYRAQDNIECGCRILKYYIDYFSGILVSGITAYNKGPGGVIKIVKNGKSLYKVLYTRLIVLIRRRIDRLDQTKCNGGMK